jgi:hypothetical protein
MDNLGKNAARVRAAEQDNDGPIQALDLMVAPPLLFRTVGEYGKVTYSFTKSSSASVLVGQLDPNIDTGWLVVQYHKNADMIVATLHDRLLTGVKDDAVVDELCLVPGFGGFTLTHRAAPEGAPDHLIMYVYENPDAEYLELPWRSTLPHLYFIVQPDGSMTRDPSILKLK